MKSFLIIFLICLSLSLKAQEKPNILLIITDQHHANMLSAAGNPYLKTRAIDSLAESGIRFTNAYVTNPVCVPSRISLATGVMAGRFGVLNNGMKAKIPAEVTKNSLGKLMKKAGYATFYGGKVHMPKELSLKNAGYDEVSKDDRDKLAGDCLEFMTQKRKKPFFAVASFINPHDICYAYGAKRGNNKKVMELFKQAEALPEDQLPPLPENSAIPELEPDGIDQGLKIKAITPAKLMRQNYTDRDWRNYRWIYCRLTEKVDRQIGELLDGMEKKGLDKNTLIVFTSDHGDMDASHRLASKNVFYQNSVGIPFIMQYKGNIPAGIVNSKSLISNGLDLIPTLCEFAGVKAPEYLLGRSLKQVAEGGADNPRRPFIACENDKGRMIRTERFKYSIYREGKIRESLVDLKNDPGEMKNIAQNPEYQSILKEHRGHMCDWADESHDHDAISFIIPVKKAK